MHAVRSSARSWLEETVDGACKSRLRCTSAPSPITEFLRWGKPSPRERSQLLEVAIVLVLVALPALPGAIGREILAVVSMAALASASHPRAIVAFVIDRVAHGIRPPGASSVACM